MRTFVNFLLSGFGTRQTAAQALGITILLLLGVFIIAWYMIAGIVRLIRNNKASTSSDPD